MFRIPLLITTISISLLYAQSDTTELVMGFPRSENSIYGQITKSIFDEVFKRIGYKLNFKSCIPENCGEYIINGNLDGELARVKGYEKLYPGLIPVQEPYISLVLGTFSNKKIIDVTNWESLKNKNYRIAFIRGYELIATNLKRLMDENNLVPVSNLLEGLDKVNKGEVDIFIGREKSVANEIKRSNFNISKISTIENEASLFVYLHKKHEKLAAKLSTVIKQMKEDGTLKILLSQFNTDN